MITSEQMVARVLASKPEFAIVTTSILQRLIDGAEDLLDDHSDQVEIVG